MKFLKPLNDVILASSSPRRVELLRSLGLRVDVRPTNIEEGAVPGLTPRELAAHHSAAKCDAALRAAARPAEADAAISIAAEAEILISANAAILIAADTVVDVDGRALGKPADEAEARTMLHALSGREHLVHTAIDVADASSGERHAVVETTAVTFFDLDERTIEAYAASRDGLDKAGAYGIQGLGASLVSRIDGDFYTVMGFPIGRFVRVLASLGYAPPAFARAPGAAPTGSVAT